METGWDVESRGGIILRIVGLYPFNDPDGILETEYQEELQQVFDVIEAINSEPLKTKKSKEKTKQYRMLYNPVAMNKEFKREFTTRGWSPVKVRCDYPTQFYVPGYTAPPIRGASREMDFVKGDVGIEVQFGKYAFMVYNVAAKMTIFHNLGYINVGVEIVPAKELQGEMSTGVSYFEQFVWDLEQRGVSNIDIPVLVIGIAQDKDESSNVIYKSQSFL